MLKVAHFLVLFEPPAAGFVNEPVYGIDPALFNMLSPFITFGKDRVVSISKKIEASIDRSSWIRKMFEEGIKLKKKFGEENVFDFSLGNPIVPPPKKFEDLLLETVLSDTPGSHAYMSNIGYLETREALADYLSRVHGAAVDSERIIMTCGAAGALNIFFNTILDPGDEVIVPAPFFAEYQFYIDNHGGVIKPVQSLEDFSLDFEAIDAAIGERTKAVLINSPNNPSGKVYDEKTVRKLASLLEKKAEAIGHSIYLVSDEPYRDIVYDGVTLPSILQAYSESVIATSYSKSLSIPGERIGYLALGPGVSEADRIMSGLVFSNRTLGFVNAPALMQRVIMRMQGITVDIDIYRKKRDLLCEGLAKIGYSFTKPEGAFYLFPKSPIPDDVQFVKKLLEKNVLATPGTGFGTPGYFRLSYCVEDKTIVNSMPAFQAAYDEQAES